MLLAAKLISGSSLLAHLQVQGGVIEELVIFGRLVSDLAGGTNDINPIRASLSERKTRWILDTLRNRKH